MYHNDLVNDILDFIGLQMAYQMPSDGRIYLFILVKDLLYLILGYVCDTAADSLVYLVAVMKLGYRHQKDVVALSAGTFSSRILSGCDLFNITPYLHLLNHLLFLQAHPP